MDEKMKKKLYDDVENPWEFVLKTVKMYKDEFRKTSKIGSPPKIDDIIEKALVGDVKEAHEAEQPGEIKENTKEKEDKTTMKKTTMKKTTMKKTTMKKTTKKKK